MNQIVNPAMVTLAREARGYSQSQLSKLSGVSQAQISKVEASIVEASPEALAALAKALKFPLSFFFQTDPVMGAGTSEFFHRKRASVPAGVLRRIHALINITRMHVTRLLRAADLPECRIPSLDVADFRGGASEVARVVRATLNLPGGPVPNLTQVIENAGGLVVPIVFGTPEVDAISRWVPGLPPLFFINTVASVDRYRMSLAHELGHMVLHRIPSERMEDEANQFAAEFLMPAKDIKNHLFGLSISRLAALKPHWRVSMAALLMRASDLECIDRGGSEYLWRQISARGYRKREPAELDLTPEQPALLKELLDYHRTDLGYTVENFAKIFSSEPWEVLSSYPISLTRPEVERQFTRVK